MNHSPAEQEVKLSGSERTAGAPPVPGRLMRVCDGVFAGVEGIVIERLCTSRALIAVRSAEAGLYLELAEDLLADES